MLDRCCTHVRACVCAFTHWRQFACICARTRARRYYYTAHCARMVAGLHTNHIEFYEGDSKTTLPVFAFEAWRSGEVYDAIHIDGGHDFTAFLSDILNAGLLAHHLTTVVIDDCDAALDCSKQASRTDTQNGYACSERFCVCDVVRGLVQVQGLILVPSPLHEGTEQCFARFGDKLLDHKNWRRHRKAQTMVERKRIWEEYWLTWYRSVLNVTQEVRAQVPDLRWAGLSIEAGGPVLFGGPVLTRHL